MQRGVRGGGASGRWPRPSGPAVVTACVSLVAALLAIVSPPFGDDGVLAEPAPTPMRETTLAGREAHDVVADPASGRVFVSGGDKVEVFAADGAVVTQLGGYTQTRGLAVGDGHLYVADVGTDLVTEVDTTTLATTDTIDTGEELVGDITRQEGRLWLLGIGLYGNRLVSYDLATSETVARPLGKYPERLAPDPDHPGWFIGWRPGSAVFWLLDADAESVVIATATVNPGLQPVDAVTDVVVFAGSAFVVSLGPGGLDRHWGPMRYSLPSLTLASKGIEAGFEQIAIDPATDLRVFATESELLLGPATGGPPSHKLASRSGPIARETVVIAPDTRWVYAVTSSWNSEVQDRVPSTLVTWSTTPSFTANPPTVVDGVPTVVRIRGEGLGSVSEVAIDGSPTSHELIDVSNRYVTVPGTLQPGPHTLSVTNRFGTGTTTITAVENTGGTIEGQVTDAAGAAVGAGTVTVSGASITGPLIVPLASDGSFSVPGLPLADDYRVAIDGPSSLVDQIVTGIQVVPNGSVAIPIELSSPVAGPQGPMLAMTTVPGEPLPLRLGIVHHAATGRTFVSGDDGVLVFDERLDLIGRVHRSVYPTDLAADDGTVVAIERSSIPTSADEVLRIDPATLEVTGQWSLGTSTEGDRRHAIDPPAIAAGDYWVRSDRGLLRLDPVTGMTETYTDPAGPTGAPAEVQGAPGQLITAGSELRRWDVSTEPPTLLTTYPLTNQLRVVDASKELNRVWLSSGEEVDLTTGLRTGRSLVGSLQSTPAHGGLVAVGGSTSLALLPAGDGQESHHLAGRWDRVAFARRDTALLLLDGAELTLLDLRPLGAETEPPVVVAGVPTDLRIRGTGLGGVTGVTQGDTSVAIQEVGHSELLVGPVVAAGIGTPQLTLVAPYGTSTVPLTVVPDTGAVLAGVVQSGSSPITGAALELTGGALAAPRNGTTDDDGSYSFAGIPYGADYRLTVTDPSGTHHPQVISGMTLRPNGRRAVDVTLSPTTGQSEATAPVVVVPKDAASTVTTLDTIGIAVTTQHDVTVVDELGRVVARLLDRDRITDVALLGGAVWLRDHGSISRVDPSTWEVTAAVGVGEGGPDLVAAGGRLWFSQRDDVGAPTRLAWLSPSDLGWQPTIELDPSGTSPTTRLGAVDGSESTILAWGGDAVGLGLIDVDGPPGLLASGTPLSATVGVAASAATGAGWTSAGERIDLADLSISRFVATPTWARGVAALRDLPVAALGGDIYSPATPSSIGMVMAPSGWPAFTADGGALFVLSTDGTLWRADTSPRVRSAMPRGLTPGQPTSVRLRGDAIAVGEVTVDGTSVDVHRSSSSVTVDLPASLTDQPIGTWLPVTVTTPFGATTELTLLRVGPTPPSAVGEVTTYSRAGGTVVEWREPPDDAGTPVLAYEVRLDGRVTTLDASSWPGRHAWRPVLWVPGVNGEQPTTAQVRAVNAAGAGPWVASEPTLLQPGRFVFSDVPIGHPFWIEVGAASVYDIADGDADGVFHPATPVSRQAAVAFLWRMAGEPLVDPGGVPFPDPGFSDVGPDHPFRTAIWWAVSEGIVQGYSDGAFRGASDVTRQTWLSLQWRAAGGPPIADGCRESFPDVGPTNLFRTAIAWAACENIAGGYPDGSFRPTALVTRQAAVAFLIRPTWPHWAPVGP